MGISLYYSVVTVAFKRIVLSHTYIQIYIAPKIVRTDQSQGQRTNRQTDERIAALPNAPTNRRIIILTLTLIALNVTLNS